MVLFLTISRALNVNQSHALIFGKRFGKQCTSGGEKRNPIQSGRFSLDPNGDLQGMLGTKGFNWLS